MSIKPELETAFKEILSVFADFKVVAEVEDNSVGGYDFGSQSVSSGSALSQVEGISVARKQSFSSLPPDVTRVFYAESGQFEPGFYDEITIRGSQYSILDYDDNGVFVTLQLKGV